MDSTRERPTWGGRFGPSPTAEPGRPLSVRLRAETRLAHRLVDATRFAKAFFKGTLTQAVYAESLTRIFPVYAAMERLLSVAARTSVLGGFHLPEVYRAGAIVRDMSHFGRFPSAALSAATAAYVDRITSIGEGRLPTHRLIAHAYVRYMADVSGGVLARRVAQKVLKLPSREGLAYFDFDHLDPQAFRTVFHARLDGASLSRAECAEVVDEANRAFELNRGVADEVWTGLLK